ncbi:MAG: hypothetical protein KIT31_07540 [Deltaproteobacteria bacterium]|nr:hypothetical protein [Deltaproteobacteria bacterium]
MRAAGPCAVIFSLVACSTSSDAPAPVVVDPPVRPTRPAMQSTSVVREPPPQPTASELVAEGQHWRLTTPRGPVHVWIPKGYRARGAETIVYVHGFYVNVDQAWEDYHLPRQFAAATINAAFIACEAPSGPTQAVSWTKLGPLLDAVEEGIAQKLPRRRIVTVGHSGAYRTLLGWLDEPLLDTVVLFDAAYGDIEKYRTWVNGGPKRRLIDVGDDTRAWTDELHRRLPESVILDGFPSVDEGIPPAAAKAKVLYIKSTLGHFPLVTGGIALPMILQTLRARKLLDIPLANLVGE